MIGIFRTTNIQTKLGTSTRGSYSYIRRLASSAVRTAA
jgi:hypothetical protein